MLITEVPSALDPTLPIFVPTLPNPATHRWVADSIVTDGAVSGWSPTTGALTLTQATAANQPVSGVVDGLRGITFDGSNDRISHATPALPLQHSVYIVAKASALSGGVTRILFEVGGGYFLGLNSTDKWWLVGSSGSVALTTTAVVGKWMVFAFAVDKTPAGGSQLARIASSVDIAGASVANITLGAGAFTSVNIDTATTANSLSATVRDVALTYNAYHTIEQMQANIAALKAEYAIV